MRTGWWSSSDGAALPVDPDYHRYFVDLHSPVGSWSLLGPTIWTPCWLDAQPAPALMCSAWGGYGDESKLFPANI